MTHAALCGAALLASAAAAPVSDDAAWTACMTERTPAALRVERCRQTLVRGDLSAFHRSLLLGSQADALADLRHYRQAIAVYTQALAQVPDDEANLAGRALAEEARGALRAAEHDLTAAIRIHEADRRNRDNATRDVVANAYAVRGRVRLERGRASTALRDLRQAMRLYQQNVSPALRALERRARLLVSGRCASVQTAPRALPGCASRSWRKSP